MAKLTDSEYQLLRAEYMRGDVDWSHVKNKLMMHGYDEQEAADQAARWQRAKHRKALGDGL